MTENPGPSASRYPISGYSRIPFMPAMHGVVQSFGARAGRCAKIPIGSTAAPAAVCKCGSAGTVIVATPIARVRAPRTAAENHCNGPGLVTKAAIEGPLDMRPAKALGVDVVHKK